MSTATVNLPPEDLRPGQIVDGRYRVEARLAQGGMATVYRAFDDRLDRLVALKVIEAGLARRPEYVARFIREAKSCAKLNHPNIVAVYDQSAIRQAPAGYGAANQGTLAYLAMEYVPGSTLRQVLGRRGRLTPRQALQVLDAMLAGLGAAHRAGIVHRDVKPENVLINDAVLAQSHSYAAALKVTDFGLARSVAGSADGTLGGSLPGGGLIGTASYLAPELVRFGTCDQRSDVYSAGIVLFELLTGRKPFIAATPVQVAQMHATDRVPAPSSLLPGLDPAIDALVSRATAREPDQRPADANGLRTELRAAYANLPDAALDFGGPTATETTQQLHNDAVGSTRADVAPTRVDLADQPPAGTKARPQTPLPPILPRRDPDEPYRIADENGKRRSLRGLVVFLVIVVLAAVIGFGAWFWGSTHYQSMPDLTGLAKTQAEQALNSDGLKYTVKQAPSTTVGSGEVISTDPGSGSPVSDGSTVTLTVSSGPAQVNVPNVTGLTQSDATSQLKSAGFAVAVATPTQFSSSVAAGDVVAYTPSGTQTQGTTITLTISGGSGQTTVPDVTGKNITDATNELQQDGFKVVTHHVTLVFNTVVNQSPSGGDSTTPGGTVTLYY
ncbi:Stk1 family PASTA domain-containing Ser/Thr kinase [Actinospica sp.]|uniref:Stk1 family PASTA domain-containing Ser/Thr kinase n=1 Tax=Actinospica sp. TaxID=1872142 RepID=UPI002B5AF886|nr:Stk1 family PASTA domain-containing Ser/Thr kinase [Actinospica sp.]HWG22822.1 Stk1 family PASTA domain-containing Ser/Thr kinase [Actinospica sp.]